MHLYLTARHIELTEALHDHVERHLKNAIESHSLPATRMEVQLYRISERDARFGCHILLDLTHRHEINIREEDRDLYAAIDLTQKRLMRVVTDYRGRQLTEGRRACKDDFERLASTLGWEGRRPERRRKSHGTSV